MKDFLDRKLEDNKGLDTSEIKGLREYAQRIEKLRAAAEFAFNNLRDPENPTKYKGVLKYFYEDLDFLKTCLDNMKGK